MRSVRPIVALVTDFGTRDFYVGALKGAVLAVCPEATLVDVVHELPRHAVEAAAFCVAAAYRAFPPRTVFVVVVDPGVGSERRALAIAAGGYFFVGPDNGVLSTVLDEWPAAAVRELTNAALFRPSVSSTFHGRDVFAPVAGHLARGLPFDAVGPAVGDPVRLERATARRLGAADWQCAIVQADRFGNLTTSLTEAQLATALESVHGDPAALVVRAGGCVLPLVRRYCDVDTGEACALLGSAGRLELAVNQGDAGEMLGLRVGDTVHLCRAPAPASERA